MTGENLETPSPLNPLGIKGAGEAGVIPSAAVFAALAGLASDLLSPFASAALAGFLSSSALAVAFSDLATGDFDAGTDFTFVAGLTGTLGLAFAACLSALGAALVGLGTGLITFFAMGFVAGLTSFPDF